MNRKLVKDKAASLRSVSSCPPAVRTLVLVSWVGEGKDGKPEPCSDAYHVLSIIAGILRGCAFQTVILCIDGRMETLADLVANGEWPSNAVFETIACPWDRLSDHSYLDGLIETMNCQAMKRYNVAKQTESN